MTAIAPGDYVFARADVVGRAVRGWDAEFIAEGQEMLVTSVLNGGQLLNVRTRKTARVVRVQAAEVTLEGRRLGEMPADGISPEDPRVAWIFEDAARIADRSGYCSVFDSLTDQMGVPGRLREFSLSYTIADGVKLTAKIKARSRAQAEAQLARRMTSARMPKAIEAAS